MTVFRFTSASLQGKKNLQRKIFDHKQAVSRGGRGAVGGLAWGRSRWSVPPPREGESSNWSPRKTHGAGWEWAEAGKLPWPVSTEHRDSGDKSGGWGGGFYHQPLSDDTSSPSARLLLVFLLAISVVKALTELQINPKCFVAWENKGCFLN